MFSKNIEIPFGMQFYRRSALHWLDPARALPAGDSFPGPLSLQSKVSNI